MILDKDKFYFYSENIFVFVNVSSSGLKEAFQKMSFQLYMVQPLKKT